MRTAIDRGRACLVKATDCGPHSGTYKSSQPRKGRLLPQIRLLLCRESRRLHWQTFSATAAGLAGAIDAALGKELSGSSALAEFVMDSPCNCRNNGQTWLDRMSGPSHVHIPARGVPRRASVSLAVNASRLSTALQHFVEYRQLRS